MARSQSGKYPKQISFQIDDESFELLKTLSNETGAPVAWLIRSAIAQLLETKDG